MQTEISQLKNNSETQKKEIENILQEQNKNYTEKIASLETKINNQTKFIVNLMQNPVPIGFIYVQLSGQKDPQTLWPNTQWNNVSPNYAGLFFRAEGGNASSFGTIQDE